MWWHVIDFHITFHVQDFHVYEWGWGNNLHTIELVNRDPHIRYGWIYSKCIVDFHYFSIFNTTKKVTISDRCLVGLVYMLCTKTQINCIIFLWVVITNLNTSKSCWNDQEIMCINKLEEWSSRVAILINVFPSPLYMSWKRGEIPWPSMSQNPLTF
jgi:hypothetical protein